MTTAATQRALDLIAARGSASLAEAGLGPDEALAIARERPEIEPVYLARFRSRQGRVRVEEVRAYAWPSQQIAMRHLGYRVEEARLLRLEPRRPVPFPARLYASFEKAPKLLEALRLAEKAYERAIKQAPGKPGRTERDLVAVQPAFRKLGEEVALEMWIEAAATFQALDNPTYASKMLGNLLRLVEKDRKVDPSRIARTVLTAADDGVFNPRLYEFTWDLCARRVSVEAALGFGLRVFRRLLTSGRPLPADFVRDLRRAAERGSVAGFEELFDSTLVWAAGLPSFWNTSRKSSSWREERTQDHAETALLRRRFVELWARARGEGGGEAWKAEIWGRIRAAMPELSAYGRAVLVEALLAADQRPGPGAPGREDAGRLLEATLAMLCRPPRSVDRERVERAGDAALAQVRAVAEGVLRERAEAIDEALRGATGDLASFVALADLLSDLSDELGRGEDGQTLLASLPGLEAAWVAALTAALLRTEGPQASGSEAKADGKGDDEDEDDEDEDGEDEDEGEAQLPIVPLLGEAIALLEPDQAPELLGELGPLLASRLSWDLKNDAGLEAWAPVLAALRALGPVGAGVAASATERFVARSGDTADFGNAARLAHLLDEGALVEAAESRRATDEALARLLEDVRVPASTRPLLRPERELGPAHSLVDVIVLADGSYSLLWAKDPRDEYAEDRFREVAITVVSADGAAQRVVGTGNLKGAGLAAQWATAEGPRVVAIKDRTAQLFDAAFKPVGKLVLPDEFEEHAYDREVIAGRRFALIHQDQVALLVDPALKPVALYEASGWGSWAFLDAPDGHEAVVIATTYNNIRAIFLGPGREAPPIKQRDYGAPVLAARTDDGAWFIDHTTTRQGERRRIRLGERGWERIPVELPARPVIDAFSPDDQAWVPLVGGEAVGYVDPSEPRAILDFTGRKIALCPEGPGELEILDARTGLAIFAEGIVVDPSLPARVAAAPHLRAAARPKEEASAGGAPLPRALYRDREGLAAHLGAQLAEREAGRAALAALGPHREAVLDGAAGALLPVLAARAAVLDALAAPAPAVPRIPRHLPGVRRVEVRRAARAAFPAPLDGLIFWALDGDDPRPALDLLAPAGGAVHAEAWSTAVRLVGLAQRTSRALAERALRLAEAIAGALERPDARFRRGGGEGEAEDDDDALFPIDDVEVDEVPVRDLSRGGAGLLWEPRGRLAARESPVRWEGDLAARSAAVQRWIRGSLLGTLAIDALAVVRERPAGVGRYRAEVRAGGAAFEVQVAVRLGEGGLDWKILGVSGEAPLDAWHGIFAQLEEALARQSPASGVRGVVWPAGGAPRPEELVALRRGVAITRAHLDERGGLRPESWPAPEIRGLEDPRHRRWVLLAWVLGRLDAASVGSTRAVFEKIARATPLVDQSWDTLRPQRHRGKPLEVSPELLRLRLTAVARAPGGQGSGEGPLEDLVVLQEPAEIAEVFAREAGLHAAARPASRRGGRAS